MARPNWPPLALVVFGQGEFDTAQEGGGEVVEVGREGRDGRQQERVDHCGEGGEAWMEKSELSPKIGPTAALRASKTPVMLSKP